MSNHLSFKRRELHSPAERHFAITPENGVDLAPRPTAIYCEASGTVAIRDIDGTILSYTLIQGTWLPFCGVGVEATGTTATVYGWTTL